MNMIMAMKLITDSGLNFYSLDISILPRPALSTNDNVTSSCICDPLLQSYNIVCNISDVSVLNTSTFTSTTSGTLVA